MKNMWKVAFLVLICGVFHNWSTAFGENAALLKEFLLKGLEENLSRLDTVECRYNSEVFDTSGKKSYVKEISWKYDLKNKKEYMKIVLYDQPDKILNVIEVSLNHKEETGIEIRKHRESIEFTGKPASGKILNKEQTLSYTNYGLPIDIPPSSFFSTVKPAGLSIKEILMDPNTQVLPQKEYIENDECYVIYLPKSSKTLPQDADLFTKMRYTSGYKIWFSPEKGYLPRKMEIFGPDPRKPLFIYIIRHKKFEQDIWFPIQFIYSSGFKPEKKYIMEYKNIRINQQMNNAVFDLKFPPGTEVHDERTGISFTVPER